MPTKVLLVQPHSLSYQLPGSNEQHPIADISEKDVLGIVRAIMHDSTSVVMDELPDDTSQINPASVVIYEELKSQFDSLITRKQIIDTRLNANFAEAERYFSDIDQKSELLGI